MRASVNRGVVRSNRDRLLADRNAILHLPTAGRALAAEVDEAPRVGLVEVLARLSRGVGAREYVVPAGVAADREIEALPADILARVPRRRTVLRVDVSWRQHI